MVACSVSRALRMDHLRAPAFHSTHRARWPRSPRNTGLVDGIFDGDASLLDYFPVHRLHTNSRIWCYRPRIQFLRIVSIAIHTYIHRQIYTVISYRDRETDIKQTEIRATYIHCLAFIALQAGPPYFPLGPGEVRSACVKWSTKAAVMGVREFVRVYCA